MSPILGPVTISFLDVSQLPQQGCPPASPTPPDPAQVVRYNLRKMIAQHDAACRDARCSFRANLLAFLAHCIAANRNDLQRLPSYLVQYDLKCGDEGRCEFHRECAAAAAPAPVPAPVVATEVTSMSPVMLFRLSGWTFVAALARLAARSNCPRAGEFLYRRAIAGLSKLSMRLR